MLNALVRFTGYLSIFALVNMRDFSLQSLYIEQIHPLLRVFVCFTYTLIPCNNYETDVTNTLQK